MAKDSKRDKLNKESKSAPTDNDIHLNVVGVPEKNVQVKKTYNRQNNEDYQLYRISIDTKGKQRETKRRLSSLEPIPNRAKNRQRHKSNDNDFLSSDDSYLDISRPQKSRPPSNKAKVSTPKPIRRRESVASEICFTIPGEKGKAVRIVGSSTKPKDEISLDRSSRGISPHRSSGKGTESPKQVGFAKLDEVYGTSPEDTSLDSHHSYPYKKTSPQVYKMEDGSPSSPFNDSKNKKFSPGRNSSLSLSSDPNKKFVEQRKPSVDSSPLTKRSKQVQDLQPENKDTQPSVGSSPLTKRSKQVQDLQPENKEPQPSVDSSPLTKRSKQGQDLQSENKEPQPSVDSSPLTKRSKQGQDLQPENKETQPSVGSSPLTKRSKQGQDLQPKNKELLEGVQSAGSHLPDYFKPSTSKHPVGDKSASSPSKQSGHSGNIPGNKNITDTSSAAPTTTSYYSSINETTSEKSSDSKGKYPFYPYDKQKRSKSPTKQEHKIEKEEDQGYPKLESIPEVRSTEHYPLTHSSGSLEHSHPPKESSALIEPITKSNEADRNTTPVPPNPEIDSTPAAPASSKSFKKQDDAVGKNEHNTFKNLFKHKKPVVPNETSPQNPNESTPQSPSTMQTNGGSKPTLQTLSNTQRGSPILSGSPRLSQLQRLPQRTSQTTPPTSPKMQNKSISSFVSYNVQNASPIPETLSTNKRDFRDKPQGLVPAVRSKNSPAPQEGSLNRLQTLETHDSRNSREPKLKKDQVPAINQTPIVMKQPETVDKQVNTEKPLKPRDRIMAEINEELSKKSSPLNPKSLQGSANRTASSDDKDSKRTKSKLSTFVSSIPKPLFGRNKSLEKKSTDKSVVSDKTQPKPEKNPNVTKGKEDERKPVEESAIVKKAHKPVLEAYPEWVTSPDQQEAINRRDDAQPQTFKDGPISNNDEPEKYSKDFTPYGIENSSSVEIANRSYGEHPLTKGSSTEPTLSEQVGGPSRYAAAGKDENSPNYLGNRDKGVKGDESKSSKSEGRKPLLESHSHESVDGSLEHMKDPNYENHGKSRPIFEGHNVVAFPGQLNEQSPFGYESQYPAGSKDDTKALISLEEGFDAYKRINKSKEDTTPQLVDRNPSLVSRASRSQKDESKQKFNGYPVQVLKSSFNSQSSSERRKPEEIDYNYNKNVQPKNMAFDHGSKADKKSSDSKGDTNRSSHASSSLNNEETKTKPFNQSAFGKTPVEQVYVGHVPDKTHNVFNPDDPNKELSPYEGKSKAPTANRQVPKGILIFVNKKNVTASPFSSGSPRSSEGSSKKAKTQSSSQKKKKRRTSSSGDTSASTILGSSSYASGDPNVVVEKSSSGRKTTLRFPCGCIRVITTDPVNQMKKEELISAFCKEGSKCEVSRRQRSQLGRSIDESSVSWDRSSTYRPDRSGTFPDIEVIADGVLSRNPIKPKPPAPTMNGAKLTGSFKIKSNKVNGVCNFYLDRKLKNYLRNNMDKIKQILED